MAVSARFSIDGTTATGKTSLGQWLAAELRTPFVDTGLTYRALALATVQYGSRPSFEDVSELLDQIRHKPFTPWLGVEREHVTLRGIDVTHLIWSEACNGVLPWLSEDPHIRARILEFHRSMVAEQPFIAAGRDVATTLMVDAALNVVLTAEFRVRRARRRRQIQEGGWGTAIVGATSRRDLMTLEAVEGRASALIIDTSALSLEDVRQLVRLRLVTA